MRSGLLLGVMLVTACPSPPRPVDPPPPQPPPPADASNDCLHVFPEALDFGEIDALTNAFARVRLTNVSSREVPLQISEVSAPFTLFGGGQRSLPAGQSILFDVHFQPRDGLLHFSEFDARGPGGCFSKVPLRGLGSGLLSVSPMSLDFGAMEPGQARTLELRLANTRRTALILNELSVVGATQPDGGPGPFSLALPSRLELAPLSITSLSVTAAPRAFGRFIGALVGTSSRERLNVPLEVIGGAPIAQLVPSSLSALAGFSPGSSPPSFIERVVSLHNLAEDAGSGFSGLRLQPPFLRVEGVDGGSPLELELQPDSELFSGLSAGDQASVVLRLSPGSLGPRTFRVTLFTNDPRQPEQVITLSAEAVMLPVCTLQVSPTLPLFFAPSADAGTVGVVTFTNTGTTVCLLDDVRLRRPSDPSFHLRAGGVDQRQLAPGEVHTVIISGPDAGSSERTSQLGFHVLNPNGDRQFVELRVAP